MCKPFITHQLISLKGAFYVCFVNANGDSHQKLLRSFYWSTVDFKQVRFFKCFEAKEIVSVVSLVVDNLFDFLCIVDDDLINILSEKRGVLAVTILAVI
jgi:hypothetical protein